MTWILTDDNGSTREFDNRADAERVKTELEGLGATIELAKQQGNQVVTVEAADTPTDDEAADTAEDTPETDDSDDAEQDEFDDITDKHDVDGIDLSEAVATANEISQVKQQPPTDKPVETTSNGEHTELDRTPNVSEDPISWMPEHFIDVIEGVPAINRKGYAVLAEHYGIAVQSKPVTYPGESEWEYAEFRATATTPDGDEYTGYGSAHVDRGDDKTVLGELAETRACKRAVSWATGVGMLAVSELSNEVVE